MTFSYRELVGIFLLILLILIFRNLKDLPIWTGSTDWSDRDIEVLDSLLSTIADDPEKGSDTATWHHFDPNTVHSRYLEALGLRPYLARRIVKFRNTGHAFYRPEDLLKIYGMDSTWYLKAKPWIQIQKSQQFMDKQMNSKEYHHPEREVVKVNQRMNIDIAAADSAELRRVPGIGPVLSSRIVRYRQILGGFYRVDQLQEV